MTTLNPTTLATINDRVPNLQNVRVVNQFTYDGKTDRVKVQSIHGLVQLMISERNYITGDQHHPRIDDFCERAGFFGSAHMRVYMGNITELFTLIEAGEAIYTGKASLSGNDLSILDLASEIVKDPCVITFNENNSNLTERQLAALKRSFDFRKERIQRSTDTPMTSDNFECLRAYVEDYRDLALDTLSNLLQMSREDIWNNLGELVAIESESRNLVLRVNGGVLRQQPKLVFEAA